MCTANPNTCDRKGAGGSTIRGAMTSSAALNRVRASSTFAMVVSVLAPLFAGTAMLPFRDRPLESACYLHNLRQDKVVHRAAGWYDHYLQAVAHACHVPEPVHGNANRPIDQWLAAAVQWAADSHLSPQHAIDFRLGVMDI